MINAVEVRNLCVRYGDRKVLDKFSLSVAPGECVLVRGPSGSGKSTLLNAVCGLLGGGDVQCSGEVALSGRPVAELSRAERAGEIGIVFQNPDTQLFCDTVEDEIAFGLENLCLPREEIARRIDGALALTRMESYRDASPGALSGGQKQLVVLASVLALEPSTLLLDEALSQLDAAGKAMLLARLEALKRSGRTLVAVDHDDELLILADRVIDMEI